MSNDCNKSSTVCGHSFHFTCLLRSMSTSNSCPMCRSPLRTGACAEMRDDGDRDLDEQDDDEYEGETEEGEIIITDETFFHNGVDLRREMLEGLIHSICTQGDLSETRHLLDENPHLKNSRGKTGDLLTHSAVLSENDRLLSHLLREKSLDPNLPNDAHAYPLHYAVLSGSLQMVTTLVNNSAFVDCTDNSKKTPLMLACDREDHDIAEFLMDRGASTMAQDASGNKPIHFAVKSRAQACLRRLISVDANVNAVNHMDETPLLVACRLGFHGVSRTLLRAGADADKKSKFGTTPADEASANGSSGLVDLLRRHVS
ncbi:unnamed protein product [Pylaiella littoralis]